jgi:hypothetical protein
MFDENIVGHLRAFIHLKDVGKLRYKTSNIAKSMEVEFFPKIRPRQGRSQEFFLSWAIK